MMGVGKYAWAFTEYILYINNEFVESVEQTFLRFWKLTNQGFGDTVFDLFLVRIVSQSEC